MNRVNLVCLGVKDLARSKKFFEDLFGWKQSNKDSDGIVFFDQGGWILGLYGRDALAEDIGIPAAGSGFQGITLAHNVREKEQVAPMLDKAASLGAEIVKPATDVFWGGHSGYFRDPDGVYWEIAWNPFMPTLEDGTLKITHE
ncbi:MAG: VOC family protein [Planctomycetes bacterium]|nr:VOC family protein [Planctomycetota bacterium]